MAWALGIAFKNGRFVAEILSDNGRVVFAPLDKLATVEAATGPHQIRLPIITQFSDWAPKSSVEYLSGLEITLPEGVHCRHTVFEFDVLGTRFLVPALAVMRALFRPRQFLLPTMFVPQALDRAAFIDYSALESPTLVVDAWWAQPEVRVVTQPILETLTWMFAAPSARTMAGSVHTSALAGRIGLHLPLGTSWLALNGTRIDGSYFVSKMSIQQIATTEPVELGENSMRGHVNFGKRFTFDRRDNCIPTRADGMIEVTDEEWEAISRILLARTKATNRHPHDPRHVFNAILTKLNSGIPWRRLKSTVNTVTDPIHAYRSWEKKGTLPGALQILIDLRLPHHNSSRN